MNRPPETLWVFTKNSVTFFSVQPEDYLSIDPELSLSTFSFYPPKYDYCRQSSIYWNLLVAIAKEKGE